MSSDRIRRKMTGRKPVLIMIYLCLAMLDCCQAVASGTDGEGLSSRQRGAETFVNLCMLCHDMKYIEYQDLMQLGLTEKKLDALRRGRSLKSSLHSDMTPDAANKMFGMAIPDLSLMAIAREKGSEHIYRLLTTYYEKPDGTVDNHEFPQVRMPDVLGYATETDQQSRAALEAQPRWMRSSHAV